MQRMNGLNYEYYVFNPKEFSLTHLCLMEFSTFIIGTSPFLFKGLLGSKFRSVAYDLSLYCLPTCISHKKYSRLIWVNLELNP